MTFALTPRYGHAGNPYPNGPADFDIGSGLLYVPCLKGTGSFGCMGISLNLITTAVETVQALVKNNISRSYPFENFLARKVPMISLLCQGSSSWKKNLTFKIIHGMFCHSCVRSSFWNMNHQNLWVLIVLRL